MKAKARPVLAGPSRDPVLIQLLISMLGSLQGEELLTVLERDLLKLIEAGSQLTAAAKKPKRALSQGWLDLNLSAQSALEEMKNLLRLSNAPDQLLEDLRRSASIVRYGSESISESLLTIHLAHVYEDLLPDITASAELPPIDLRSTIATGVELRNKELENLPTLVSSISDEAYTMLLILRRLFMPRETDQDQ
jgi:hypothetical protein